PPTGTNIRRPAPRASIPRDTLFALSGRSGRPGNLPPGGRSAHAAVTTSVSERGKVLPGAAAGDLTDSLGSRMPDLRASSDVSSGCATRVWSGAAITGELPSMAVRQ